jgi:16S rRNA (guanine(1405)-N(7))-methyltransferase
MPEKGDASLDSLVEAVRSSPKYAHIAGSFIRRIGRRELNNRRSQKEALKAVKNKLHQAAGAYLAETPPYESWLAKISAAARKDDLAALVEICRQAMGHHASTRERLPFIDSFYQQIFAALPPVHSVLDIACGLNPLSLPLMPLPEQFRYYAVDIYEDLAAFLNAFFRLLETEGGAWAEDVIESPLDIQVDLALALKAIPCLERVDRTAGERLLDSLQANHLVVSFPARSLGGKQKGMVANYEAHFRSLTSGRGWKVQRLEFPNELVFIANH